MLIETKKKHTHTAFNLLKLGIYCDKISFKKFFICLKMFFIIAERSVDGSHRLKKYFKIKI